MEQCVLHTHTFGLYTYYTNSLHKRSCACGEIQTEAHYIRSSEIVDGRYAKCLGCKRTLDLYTDVATPLAQPGITEMTANGSYILHNGIVVLADADVEAYINGTLEFYSVNHATE